MKQNTMTLDPSTMVSARRFRFVDDSALTGVVGRRFIQPRAIAVVEETIPLNTMLAGPAGDASIGQLDVIVGAEREIGKSAERVRTWLAGDADPQPMFSVTTNAGRIRLHGGRAVIHAVGDRVADLLDAVVEFRFLDLELRRLEESLLPIQTAAPGDVKFAYRIRQSDGKEWDRLGKTMEQLAEMRLSFARLEPLMGSATPTLPIEARRAMSGLLSKTHALDRLEAFSDRLEACEDLYEGAIDRITDYRWYRRGNLLELAIVVLLAIEAVLLIVEHFRR